MEFRPLHEAFGVEVLDFDLSAAPDDAQLEMLRDAYDTHQLLLFRGGDRLSPERQVEISGWFGEVAIHYDGKTHFDGKKYTVLSNKDEFGGERLPFHSDYTFTETPYLGITLYAADLPPGGTTTSFISAVHGWASLPAERQAQLADMTLRHQEKPLTNESERNFAFDHPLRLIHPKTGKPILFATEYHAHRIHELSPEESGRTIAELLGHLYSDEKVYVHHWQPHDLLVWDNLAIQHARTQRADLAQGKRNMQRVTLHSISLNEVNDRAERHHPPPLPA